MDLRVKEVVKAKGITLQDLCKRMDMSYINFNQKLSRKPNTEFIQQIADALEVSVFEIISSDGNTYHSYDEKGNWRGIVKK
ncbi:MULTISPECIES: helix-turn-helix domain-containing protein [unclassified Sphingobacterium]|uniref:helix-turn-helix domain-containing protein n=1 Tax=unclassified Sphingobacterium TaxID=2609468 RepID=UPI0020C2BF6D|nr:MULTISPECIES: helix-turn-helix domain-containing protein [unclassified Sphingobacterium]